MSAERPEHQPYVRPAVKMDTQSGLYSGACSCGWRSSLLQSRSGAEIAAQQHAANPNR